MSNDEIASDLGGRDAEPLRPGLPGRGLVLALTPSPRRTADGEAAPPNGDARSYTLRLDVRLDDLPRFEVSVVAAVARRDLIAITPGESVLAVRVDPRDHRQVVVDFEAEPPEVRVAPEPGQLAAADIVAVGEPCEAVVAQANRLGLRSPDDVDLYALVLDVSDVEGASYRVKVGMPVPVAAVRLLYPGSRLPARRLAAGGREDVVVDWEATLRDGAVVVDWGAARRSASPEGQALSG